MCHIAILLFVAVIGLGMVFRTKKTNPLYQYTFCDGPICHFRNKHITSLVHSFCDWVCIYLVKKKRKNHIFVKICIFDSILFTKTLKHE